MLAVAFTVWGLYEIISTAVSPTIGWAEVGTMIMGSFKLVIAAGGFACVIKRWPMGSHLLYVGFNVYLVSTAVQFVTQWLEWLMALAGHTTDDGLPWKPTTEDILYMVGSTVIFVISMLISCCWVFGLLGSLKMVLSVGGTGWEKKNFVEICEELERNLLEEQKNKEYEELEARFSGSDD